LKENNHDNEVSFATADAESIYDDYKRKMMVRKNFTTEIPCTHDR